MEGNTNVAIIDAHTGDKTVVDYNPVTDVVSDDYFGEVRWHTVPPAHTTDTAKRVRFDLEKMVSEGFYGFGKKDAKKHSVWDLCSAAEVSFTDPKLDDFFNLVIGRIENFPTILSDIKFGFRKDIKVLRSEWRTLIENRRKNESGDFYAINDTDIAKIKELYETDNIVSDYTRMVQTWSLAEFKLSFMDIFRKSGRKFSSDERRSILNMFKEPEEVPIRDNVVWGGRHGAVTLHDKGRVIISQDNGNAAKIADFEREIKGLIEQAKNLRQDRIDISNKIESYPPSIFLEDGQDPPDELKRLEEELVRLPSREKIFEWINDIRVKIAELMPFRTRRVYTEIGGYAHCMQRNSQPSTTGIPPISGLDPTHEWGIHVEYGRDGDKEGIVRWKCCGNSGFDHPGCWTGLPNATQKEPVPYSFFDRDTFPNYGKMLQKYGNNGQIQPAMMEEWRKGTIRGDAFDPDRNALFTYTKIHESIVELKESLGSIVADAAYEMISQKSSKGIPWNLFQGMSSRKVLSILKKLYILEYTYNKPFHLNSQNLPTSDKEWKKYIEEDMFQLTKLEKMLGMVDSYDKVACMIGTKISYIRKASLSFPVLSAKGVLTDIERLKARIDNVTNEEIEQLQLAHNAIGAIQMVSAAFVEAAETMSKMPGGSMYSYTKEVRDYDKMSRQLNSINELYLTDGIPAKGIDAAQANETVKIFRDQYSSLRRQFASSFNPSMKEPINMLNDMINIFCEHAFSDSDEDVTGIGGILGRAGTVYNYFDGITEDISAITENLEEVMKEIRQTYYDIGTVLLETQHSKEANIPNDDSDAEVIEMREIPREENRTTERAKRSKKKPIRVAKQFGRRKLKTKQKTRSVLRPPREDILRASATAGEKVQSGPSLSETKISSLNSRVVYGTESGARKILTAASKYFSMIASKKSAEESTFEINWSTSLIEKRKQYSLNDIFQLDSRGITLSQIDRGKSLEYGNELSLITNFQEEQVEILHANTTVWKHHAELFKLILDGGDELGIEKLRPANEGDRSDKDRVWDHIVYVGKLMGVISTEDRWDYYHRKYVKEIIFIDSWESDNQSKIIRTDKNVLRIPGKDKKFKALALREAALRWYIFSMYVLEMTQPKKIYENMYNRGGRKKWGIGYEPIPENRELATPSVAKAKMQRKREKQENEENERIILKSVRDMAIEECENAIIEEGDSDAVIIEKFETCLKQFKMVFDHIKDNSLTAEKYAPFMGHMLEDLHLIRNTFVHSSVEIPRNPEGEPKFPDFIADNIPGKAMKLAQIRTADGKRKLHRPIVFIYNDSFKLLTEFVKLTKTPEKFDSQKQNIIQMTKEVNGKVDLLNAEWEKAKILDIENWINYQGVRTEYTPSINDDSIEKYAILQCAGEMSNYSNEAVDKSDSIDIIMFFDDWKPRLQKCSKVALILSNSDDSTIGERQRVILLEYLILAQIYDPETSKERTKFEYDETGDKLTHDTILIRNAQELRRLGVLLANFFVAAFRLTDATINLNGPDEKIMKGVSAPEGSKTLYGFPENGHELLEPYYPPALLKQHEDKYTSIEDDPAATLIANKKTGPGVISSVVSFLTDRLEYTKYVYGRLSQKYAPILLGRLGQIEKSIQEKQIVNIFTKPRNRKIVEEILKLIHKAAVDKTSSGWKPSQTETLKDFAKKAGLYRPGNDGIWISRIKWGENPELSPNSNINSIRILDPDMLRRLFRYWGLFIRLLFIIGSRITMKGGVQAGYLTTLAETELLAKGGGSTVRDLKAYVKQFDRQFTYHDNGKVYSNNLYKLVQRFHNTDPNERGPDALTRMRKDDPYETWWDFITDPKLRKYTKPAKSPERRPKVVKTEGTRKATKKGLQGRRRPQEGKKQFRKVLEKGVQRQTKPAKKKNQVRTRPPTRQKGEDEQKEIPKKPVIEQIELSATNPVIANQIKIQIKNLLEIAFSNKQLPEFLKGKKFIQDIPGVMTNFANIVRELNKPALEELMDAHTPVTLDDKGDPIGWWKPKDEILLFTNFGKDSSILDSYLVESKEGTVFQPDSKDFYLYLVAHIKFMRTVYNILVGDKERPVKGVFDRLVDRQKYVERNYGLSFANKYRVFRNFVEREVELTVPVDIVAFHDFNELTANALFDTDTVLSNIESNYSNNTSSLSRNDTLIGDDWPEMTFDFDE